MGVPTGDYLWSSVPGRDAPDETSPPREGPLLLPDGRTVAYTENGYRGELIEETAPVVRLQTAYDSVRDLALTPAESRQYILRKLEEVPCGSVT